MQALTGGPSTPIEQVTELGDGIIQKLIAAGITTVEALADMTPEQLEEIPGIGEKTLERISVAVRHYFGHFEEGEEAPNAEGTVGEAGAPEAEGTDEPAALTAAADTERTSEGESEVETPEAAAGSAEAELENSEEVLEEAEDGGVTAEELAVDNVPEPDQEMEVETEEGGE
jgi:N utilization substance protein A